MFTYLSIALDDNTDASSATHFLIFIWGVNDKFHVVSELLSIEATKSTRTGVDLYERQPATLEQHKMSWHKLIMVIADGSLNLTGENLGLLWRVQGSYCETWPDREILFFFFFSLY